MIITLIVKVINVATVTVQHVLGIASFVGKVIISLLTGVLFTLWFVLENIYLFFKIIYEDNISIFTEDLPSFLDYLSDTSGDQLMNFKEHVLNTLHLTYMKTFDVGASLRWFITTVVQTIWEVFFILKNGTIFIGEIFWTILTFIPIQLPRVLNSVLSDGKDVFLGTFIDFYKFLLRVTNFLTDVPLQSFIGLISAITIFRLFLHYREEILDRFIFIYCYIRIKCYYWYNVCYDYFISSERRMNTSMAQDISMRQEDSVNNNDNPMGLCVICRERQKSVLILPCRHVCMCTECYVVLSEYQRTCPICRSLVARAVNVYL